MSKTAQEEKMFSKEVGIYYRHKDFLSDDNHPEKMKGMLEGLTNDYKKLLEQTRFLTWVSGRLEKKLHKANRELKDRNSLLERTIDALISARASKNAYTIIYIIAIVLFVLEEFLIEPIITKFGSGLGFSILIKLVIVLLLKVMEGVIEERIKSKRKPGDIQAAMNFDRR
jgi:hypothetical protein